jgi:DNA-binding NarL/FixJ family response regulator
MSNDRIRILCVDDNEMVAAALRRRIEFEPHLQWAGWANDLSGLPEQVEQLRPSVVLLDIDMPGDSFQLIRDLALRCPDVRVVMFSGYVRQDFIDRAIAEGAWGFVSKNSGIDEVLAAVEQVAAGEFALSAEAASEHARGFSASNNDRSSAGVVR